MSPHGHAHHHHHAHGSDSHGHGHGHHERLVGRAFLLIGGFMLVEVVAGLLTNSLTLLADAGHMFLDASALGFSWYALRLSRRAHDHNLSYGYHRYQVLATFINGLMLFGLILWIVVEALSRLQNPQTMLPLPALAVAFVGLLVNVAAFRWLHQGQDNATVRSATWHVIGDMLGSVAAITSALTVWLTGWLYADPLLALVIVVILGRGAWRLVRDSTHILLEGVPEHLDLQEIRDALAARVAGVREVHHLHAWALTAEKPLLTLHATVEQDAEIGAVVARIKAVLAEDFGIDHSTIQVEHGPCPDD
jgi:cobalt-zinc-cadmium efflux system protein